MVWQERIKTLSNEKKLQKNRKFSIIKLKLKSKGENDER